jgi:hypothetical protein
METRQKRIGEGEWEGPVSVDHELRKIFAILLCLPSLFAMVSNSHQAQTRRRHSEGVTPRSKRPEGVKEGACQGQGKGVGWGIWG